MAAPMAFKVRIEKVDPGALESSATRIVKGVTRNENQPVETVVRATTAQFQGLTQYLACIKNGDDTSTVETAVNAL